MTGAAGSFFIRGNTMKRIKKMETGKELFESIMNSCPRKKVVSLCKKLIKKCSFNSGEDARNLCSLGYRLFIYGHIDEALAVSRYTHNVPFPVSIFFILLWVMFGSVPLIQSACCLLAIV